MAGMTLAEITKDDLLIVVMMMIDMEDNKQFTDANLVRRWLDANRSNWRDCQSQDAPDTQNEMSLAEACDCLGVGPDASIAAAKKAQADLLVKCGLHTDLGGTKWIAQKIIEAAKTIEKARKGKAA